MHEKVRRDRQLQQLAAAIAGYETEFGAITPAEIASQRRSDREDAVVVRGRRCSAADGSRPEKRAKSG